MRDDDDITAKKWEIYNWKTIITAIETKINQYIPIVVAISYL
jgi:hypothetical protein